MNTPNIDRLAREGTTVSDYYGQPSCTAGRASFITGQYPIRTGLTSVGQPGAALGLKAEDPTLAELLKARGYATAQFGKSHVGDRNEHLPTVHGFDEFFGILYHLNVMEQFEQPEYPKNPNFVGRPRDVMYSWATDKDDDTADPRFGKVGRQRIEMRGALGAKRMETFDDEVLAATSDWLKRQQPAGQAVLPVVQPDAHAPDDPRQSGVDRARAATAAMPTACCTWIRSSASCSSSSTTWASPTTPSSSSLRTTASTWRTGPMPAPRRSAARRG